MNSMRIKYERVMTRVIFPLILLLYPLRHINWGLDLWDTGYNYGNFAYMGTDHMDTMWLFSTYLANALGWLITKLPFADTLLGMNFYTAFLVSGLALAGYWFCIKKAGISPYLAFLGEITAVCLCWCPTAVLYNYLTYVLFLAGSICLYLGLRDDRNKMLVIAGICLGTNVMVRFSNLAEAGMIVAVWAYAIICKRSLRKTTAQTGWCLLGYLGALGIWLGFISVTYGFTEYVHGIQRLFGMTETATDYTPVSMIVGMLWPYIENLYWVVRFCVIICAGLIGFAILPRKFVRLKKIGFSCIMVLVVGWMYHNKFFSLQYHVYDAMLRPGILFLMLALLCGVIEVIRPGASGENKLLSGMVVLIILVTPLGSNNKLFPALNNLFLVGPYVFWTIWRFCRYVKAYSRKIGRLECVLHPFPAKAMAVMLVGLLLVQGIGFSAGFAFADAAGIVEPDTQVENNQVLKGIYMNSERAGWMEEISAYVNEHDLAGKEVLLYGNIPSLSYYLGMPSAFNSWSDLRSFSIEAMKANMEILAEEVVSGEEAPVIILEKKYGARFLENEGTVDKSVISEESAAADEKFEMILLFIEKFQYSVTFANEKFVMLETR